MTTTTNIIVITSMFMYNIIIIITIMITIKGTIITAIIAMAMPEELLIGGINTRQKFIHHHQ